MTKDGVVNACIRQINACTVVTANTVNNAIRIAKVLRKYRDYHFNDGNICIRFDDEYCWNLRDVLASEDNYQFLKQFLLLKALGASVERKGNGFLVEVNGIKWFVRGSIWQDLMEGPLLPYLHEPYEYRIWFSKIITKVRTFIDVGAYVGGYAVRACKAGVKVYAVEPSAENYNVLSQNLKFNECNNVILLNVAAGDFKGKALLSPLRGYGPDTSSLVRSGDEKEVINVVPLDDVITDVEMPVMVKIDVEGFEEHVLKGMEKLLKYVGYIFIETNTSTHINVVKYLNGHGFKLRDLRLHRGSDELRYNSLFIKG